jgi:hypothetical protein
LPSSFPSSRVSGTCFTSAFSWFTILILRIICFFFSFLYPYDFIFDDWGFPSVTWVDFLTNPCSLFPLLPLLPRVLGVAITCFTVDPACCSPVPFSTFYAPQKGRCSLWTLLDHMFKGTACDWFPFVWKQCPVHFCLHIRGNVALEVCYSYSTEHFLFLCIWAAHNLKACLIFALTFSGGSLAIRIFLTPYSTWCSLTRLLVPLLCS